MRMNMHSEMTPRIRRTIMRGDDQGNVDPPLEMGMRMNIVVMRLAKHPMKSTFRSLDLKEPVTRFRGRKKVI
jgi:hypothetical protein